MLFDCKVDEFPFGCRSVPVVVVFFKYCLPCKYDNCVLTTVQYVNCTCISVLSSWLSYHSHRGRSCLSGCCKSWKSLLAWLYYRWLICNCRHGVHVCKPATSLTVCVESILINESVSHQHSAWTQCKKIKPRFAVLLKTFIHKLQRQHKEHCCHIASCIWPVNRP